MQFRAVFCHCVIFQQDASSHFGLEISSSWIFASGGTPVSLTHCNTLKSSWSCIFLPSRLSKICWQTVSSSLNCVCHRSRILEVFPKSLPYRGPLQSPSSVLKPSRPCFYLRNPSQTFPCVSKFSTTVCPPLVPWHLCLRVRLFLLAVCCFAVPVAISGTSQSFSELDRPVFHVRQFS